MLDTSDRQIRNHHLFIFIVLNIWQQRQAHLQTHLVVSRSNFSKVADRIQHVTSAGLLRLSSHLQDGSWPQEPSDEDRHSFTLLKLVNSVPANIPGSQASKLKMWNTVYFGIPMLYFTVNPCAQHSLIFQVMFGDQEVDLNARHPSLVPSKE